MEYLGLKYLKDRSCLWGFVLMGVNRRAVGTG